MKTEYHYAPTDWAFTPTTEDYTALNKLRTYHGLSIVSGVTRAKEWFDACGEIDACAAINEFNDAEGA